MKIFFKYIENIIENWLDKFFLYFGVIWEERTILELKLFLLEVKDVFLILKYGNLDYFLFSLRKLKDNNNFRYIISKMIEAVSLVFFLLMDIFGLLFIMFSNHILLAKKIFKDYVHDKYRRDILVILMFVLIIIISFSVLVLF